MKLAKTNRGNTHKGTGYKRKTKGDKKGIEKRSNKAKEAKERRNKQSLGKENKKKR